MEMPAGVRMAHHTDADEPAIAAADRHRPGEAARRQASPEMHFNIAQAIGGQLRLGGTHEQLRHAETEVPLHRVARSARQDAGAPADAGGTRRDRDAVGVDADRPRPAVDDANPRADRLVRQSAIEGGAIDHDRLHRPGRVLDGEARWGVEPDGGELVEDVPGVEAELLECVLRQDTGAMDRLADVGVLLEESDVAAGAREIPGRVEPGRTAAHDDHVARAQAFTTHQNFRPLFSHLPRAVIQNERTISFTSSARDCRLM
jgi:hypothetical protein